MPNFEDYKCYLMSRISLVPRPSPSFPSYYKQWEAERGPGNEASPECLVFLACTYQTVISLLIRNKSQKVF